MENFICSFCGRLCKNKNSLKQHSVRCKLNPTPLLPPPKTDSWYEAMARKKGTTASNQHTKAKETGVPFVVSDETRRKLSEANKKRAESFWTPEQRAKHSEAMRKAVLENPDSYTKNNVCGRVKNIEYNGVRLKGSWELEVAKWLDSNGVEWETEVNPQEYVWEGKVHLYFPDFYIKKYDLYIEVKGYKRDRDVAKWEQFKGNHVVINSTLLKKLNSLTIKDIL